MASTLVERHYAIEGENNTKNLKGVLEEIPKSKYMNMINTVKAYANSPSERGLGQVKDATEYYSFEGNNVFLENGLVQNGLAITGDNLVRGFKMTRLFANSLDKMNDLEIECGLR
jgi:hypothetical protein